MDGHYIFGWKTSLPNSSLSLCDDEEPWRKREMGLFWCVHVFGCIRGAREREMRTSEFNRPDKLDIVGGLGRIKANLSSSFSFSARHFFFFEVYTLAHFVTGETLFKTEHHPLRSYTICPSVSFFQSLPVTFHPATLVISLLRSLLPPPHTQTKRREIE